MPHHQVATQTIGVSKRAWYEIGFPEAVDHDYHKIK